MTRRKERKLEVFVRLLPNISSFYQPNCEAYPTAKNRPVKEFRSGGGRMICKIEKNTGQEKEHKKQGFSTI